MKNGRVFSGDQVWSIEVVYVSTLLLVSRDVPSMHRMRSRGTSTNSAG